MVDTKDTQPIPVELLLSSIGKQIKVDVDAHRRRLETEIEKRRQRLAELKERRAELAGLDVVDEDVSVPEAAGDAESVAGHGLFDTSSQLEDDLSDDWLTEGEELGFDDSWADDLPAAVDEPETDTITGGPDEELDLPGWADDLPAAVDEPETDTITDGPDWAIDDLSDIINDVAALDPGLTDDWEEFT